MSTGHPGQKLWPQAGTSGPSPLSWAPCSPRSPCRGLSTETPTWNWNRKIHQTSARCSEHRLFSLCVFNTRKANISHAWSPQTQGCLPRTYYCPQRLEQFWSIFWKIILYLQMLIIKAGSNDRNKKQIFTTQGGLLSQRWVLLFKRSTQTWNKCKVLRQYRTISEMKNKCCLLRTPEG